MHYLSSRWLFFSMLLTAMMCHAQTRHWTANDKLPTGEVKQIVELPNGQMLVNCEGVFCLSDGADFYPVSCDYGQTYQMKHLAKAYGRLWQGDSLLWLHDFYRVYLFDARQRTFRYDIEHRLTDSTLKQFAEGEVLRETPNERQLGIIDSLGLKMVYETVKEDRQGGLWIGTHGNGIVYLSPLRPSAQAISGSSPLIDRARSMVDSEGRIWRCKANGLESEANGFRTVYHTNNVKGLPYNRTTFICQLLPLHSANATACSSSSESRYLLCDSLCTLGYFIPERQSFSSLNAKLPQLKHYRHFVGACPVTEQWTVVYAQNGIFMLDTQADTIAPFPPAKEIARYATKYNCMVKDRNGRLWIGTQNGLFSVDQDKTGNYDLIRVSGLRNNCIRSLITDKEGHVWAGTSCGISRITPTVVNLGPEDGIPSASMMERAACSTADGRLVFVIAAFQAVSIHPDSIINKTPALPVVISHIGVNGSDVSESMLKKLRYEQNHLSIYYSTLNYAAPSHNNYRHRLHPIEKGWVISSDGCGQGCATYAALPPGDYTFEVEASSPDGNWGTTTTLSIVISPPLWLTWWAKLCYFLVAIAGALWLIGYYLRRRKIKMERENDERVNQLFELRTEARYQFAQSVSIDPQKISSTQQEEELVEKLLKAIGAHMDDSDYTVDQLASDVAMSRASLYKKMQTMLGITPNEFLRNVRLKHAAKLLAESEIPVNQVALMVGFQTPRYFSQCFRQLFGVLPTEYRNGLNTNPST